MAKRVATYEDAKLILKLYELRREEKMRAAREWYTRRFFPQSFEDVKAILAPGNPDNPSLRMVFGYWDMAASFIVHGVLDPELFFASGGEMLFMWAKIEPFVVPLRAEMKAPVLANVEKALAGVPWVPERLRSIRERMVRLRDAAVPSR